MEQVWIVADTGEEPKMASAVLEALTPARLLAGVWSGNVRVLLFTSSEIRREQTATLLQRGASRVTVLRHPGVASSESDVRVDAIDAMLAHTRPRVLLAATASNASSWAVRLAARRRLPVVTRCIELTVSPTGFHARREALGGAAHVSLEIPMKDVPAVFLLEPGSWNLSDATVESDSAGPEEARVEVVEICARGVPPAVGRLRLIIPDTGELDLEDADLIVAGGAGLNRREGFAELRETARALGGAVGATRVAVDHGWARPEEQIGLTGHQVTPLVYLAFGISGAREHLSGLPNGQNLVAVNTDASAPIASVSRLFAVADAREILSALRTEAGVRLANANRGEDVVSGGQH